MFLADKEIINLLKSHSIVVENIDENYIRTASIDLKASNTVSESKENTGVEINSDSTYDDIKNCFHEYEIKDKFILKPKSSVIARTNEIITINSDHIGIIVNRNSLVRLGISVSISIINPGYSGFLPFIIRNESNFNFSFKEGDRLCQLIIAKTTDVEKKYGQRPDSKYINNNSLLSRYDSDKNK
jgi:deoxycytidine triphosphate deaminase